MTVRQNDVFLKLNMTDMDSNCLNFLCVKHFWTFATRASERITATPPPIRPSGHGV